ncbi:MAG: CCE_0567 family metalloprotein [Nostocaceae cyanobacterium]|nr:CCE_0567 family metalloprotein [Nostocaceae cyanobacterium]
MVQAGDIALSIDELKTKIRKLNSRAGQMKMDLHDLAEGLPTNYEQLTAVAAETYEIFRLLDELKKQLKTLEKAK